MLLSSTWPCQKNLTFQDGSILNTQRVIPAPCGPISYSTADGEILEVTERGAQMWTGLMDIQREMVLSRNIHRRWRHERRNRSTLPNPNAAAIPFDDDLGSAALQPPLVEHFNVLSLVTQTDLQNPHSTDHTHRMEAYYAHVLKVSWGAMVGNTLIYPSSYGV